MLIVLVFHKATLLSVFTLIKNTYSTFFLSVSSQCRNHKKPKLKFNHYKSNNAREVGSMKQSEESCLVTGVCVFSVSGAFFSSSLFLPTLCSSCSPLLCFFPCPSPLAPCQASRVVGSRLGSVVQGEQALRELPHGPMVTYLY